MRKLRPTGCMELCKAVCSDVDRYHVVSDCATWPPAGPMPHPLIPPPYPAAVARPCNTI